MSIHRKVLVCVVVLIVGGVFVFSPPFSLSIEITADPQSFQEFYVVTRSSVPGFHGRDVKTVDKRMVLANSKTKIPLYMRTHWFGTISTTTHHPEYFRELEAVSSRFFRPKVQISPTSWIDAFAKSPRWVTQGPSMNQPSEQYQAEKKAWGAAIDSHEIIHMSHAHYHISSMNTEFLELFVRPRQTDELQKSIEVLDTIVEELDKRMLEKSSETSGLTEYVQQQINETHAALDEIHQKFGLAQDAH